MSRKNCFFFYNYTLIKDYNYNFNDFSVHFGNCFQQLLKYFGAKTTVDDFRGEWLIFMTLKLFAFDTFFSLSGADNGSNGSLTIITDICPTTGRDRGHLDINGLHIITYFILRNVFY